MTYAAGRRILDADSHLMELPGFLDAGCSAIHVPSTAAGERSPSHADLDPFWSLLEESGHPFVLHVGGGGRPLDRAMHNNGRPVTDHLGGDGTSAPRTSSPSTTRRRCSSAP